MDAPVHLLLDPGDGLVGVQPLRAGAVRVQLRMVWHRYSRNGSSRSSSRSPVASSRLSTNQRQA